MAKRVNSIYLLGGIAYCSWLLLAISGLIGTQNQDHPDLWTPGYIWPVLTHGLYGMVLFSAIVIPGTVVLRALARLINFDDNDVRILAIPAGMVIFLGVSIALQLGFVAQAIAIFFMAGSFITYGLSLRGKRTIPTEYGVLVALLAIAMGAVFAFIWKPTIGLHTGSTGVGDKSMYSGWYYSLKASIYPFYHLGSEGEINQYFNQLHTFYALALDALPGFNIYLFNITSVCVFFVLSTAYTLRVFSSYRSSIGLKPLSKTHIILITTLFLAASRHPSWVVESPPIIFMTPIIFAALYAVERAGDNVGRLGFALALAIIGSVLSKIVTLAVLGAYTGIKFLQWIIRHARIGHYIFFGIFICVIASYVFYMVQSFGALFLTSWEPGPEFLARFADKGWGQFHKVIPKLLKDVGLVLIVVGVWKTKDLALIIASLMALATHFLFPFLFTSTPAAILILLAGYIMTVDDISQKTERLLLWGALAFLPHHYRHDPGNWYPLALWAFTLGITVYLTLSLGSRSNTTTESPGTSRTKWRHVAGALVIIAVTLISLGNGSLRIGKKNLELIPTSLYDIWNHTRLNTPVNALIFTDQTGNNRQRLSGWNDYALMAQRQFYVVTWSSGPMRHEPGLLEERLSNNAAVLNGNMEPSDLELSKPYGAYYSVVANGKIRPDNFLKIYENNDYALYEIKRQ
jgi:hypothetical protein